jgi:hypothetical protein
MQMIKKFGLAELIHPSINSMILKIVMILFDGKLNFNTGQNNINHAGLWIPYSGKFGLEVNN